MLTKLHISIKFFAAGCERWKPDPPKSLNSFLLSSPRKESSPGGWAFLIYGRAKPVSARTGITESRDRLRSSFLFGIWSTKDHPSNPVVVTVNEKPAAMHRAFLIQEFEFTLFKNLTSTSKGLTISPSLMAAMT